MLKSKKIKEIAKSIGSGITPLRSNPLYWENGTISWLKTEQLGEHHIFETSEKITDFAVSDTSIKIFPQNTLSIALYGEGKTRGNVSILKKEMATNQACCNVVIDKEKADYEFVYYFLKTQYNQLRSLSSGVRKNLNSNDIKEYEIRLPDDLETQKKIASVLSTLDSKIELNNRINAELEAMAKTLYDYWFVQFDFPDENGKPYKSSDGKMIWNDELKREIPEGWKAGNLLDIAEYTNGLPCQKYRPINDDFLRVIKIREMNEGFSANSELVKADIPKKAIIENGDILFSWSASLDVKIWTGGKGALNQHIFKVTSKGYPKSFYYFELVNYLQHFKMIAENRKTTMGHITQEHLQQSRIVLPPNELLIKIENIISPMLKMKVKNEIENKKLAELRDWLLPMLMNGQVTVGSIDKKADVIQSDSNVTRGNNFYKIQITYATISANKNIGVKQGEMATAKDIYFSDRIFGVDTGLKFERHNWGAFDPQEKAILNNPQYFKKVNFPNSNAFYIDLKDNGDLLGKIPSELKEQITNGINEMHNKVFNQYSGSKKARMKELYATILKCIEDSKTLELNKIREEMALWEITQDKTKTTKAEKFSDKETKDALETIIRENWHKNILKVT